ncbi:MAG: type I glutamate--ammonia ligase, partial [candidate division WOR-3 bacterium]
LLEHAPSLCALTNPTTNSYKRLIAGYEAPTYTDYAIGSRAAAIRIPEYVRNLNEQRIEYRIPDCMANPYLALSAIILAGLDGIEKKIVHPGKKSLPTNLLDALTEFKHDHKFLLTNNVFTEEIIDQWIEIKKSEFETVNQHPTVQEFILYYGV